MPYYSTTSPEDAKTPPLTNRGVQNTSHSSDVPVVLDWLTFTLDYNKKNFDDLKLFLGESTRREYGAYGYTHSAVVLDGGLVCWSPERPNQKICVVLPSQALANLEWSAREIIAGVINREGNVTRVDFAMDDFQGYLDMNEIHEKLQDGEVVTRWKTYDRLTGKKEIGTITNTGDTIYIGSRNSEAFLRIYDKVLERKAKGYDYDVPYHIRVELELKGKKAHVCCEKITKMFTEGDRRNFIPSLLLGLISFKEPSETETNKSRWKDSSFWTEFLGTMERTMLSLPRNVKTIEEVRRWFAESIAPMAAVLLLSDVSENVSGYDWLLETIVTGEARFKAKHKRLAKIDD